MKLNGKEKQEYITGVMIKADKKTLFAMILSPYVSKNPFVAFSYKSIDTDKLILQYTNNYGISKKIRAKFKEKKADLRLNDSKYRLTTPQIAMNENAVPVHFSSTIALKSVSIYTLALDTASRRFVAKFFIPSDAIVDFRFKIKMHHNGSVVQAIFEKEDGSSHTIENYVEYGSAVIDG